GSKVAEGKTSVPAEDPTSGDRVAVIDFSSFTTTGKGYVLTVPGQDGQRSDPFHIDEGIYKQLKNDAFKYFYHNRSGIAIEMPYAGGEQWTRPAGHPKDVVSCAPAEELKAAGWYEGGACSYRLDVT